MELLALPKPPFFTQGITSTTCTSTTLKPGTWRTQPILKMAWFVFISIVNVDFANIHDINHVVWIATRMFQFPSCHYFWNRTATNWLPKFPKNPQGSTSSLCMRKYQGQYHFLRHDNPKMQNFIARESKLITTTSPHPKICGSHLQHNILKDNVLLQLFSHSVFPTPMECGTLSCGRILWIYWRLIFPSGIPRGLHHQCYHPVSQQNLNSWLTIKYFYALLDWQFFITCIEDVGEDWWQ